MLLATLSLGTAELVEGTRLDYGWHALHKCCPLFVSVRIGTPAFAEAVLACSRIWPWPFLWKAYLLYNHIWPGWFVSDLCSTSYRRGLCEHGITRRRGGGGGGGGGYGAPMMPPCNFSSKYIIFGQPPSARNGPQNGPHMHPLHRPQHTPTAPKTGPTCTHCTGPNTPQRPGPQNEPHMQPLHRPQHTPTAPKRAPHAPTAQALTQPLRGPNRPQVPGPFGASWGLRWG